MDLGRSGLLLFVALVSSLAGCSSGVVEGDGGASTTTTSDAGGGGAGGAATTTTSNSGGGGAGGTTTTSTAPDPVVCEGAFNVSVEAQEANGTKHGCGFGSDLSWSFEHDGVVTGVAGNTVSIDTCPPGTACDPNTWAITVTAAPLVVAIPTGTFVHFEIGVEADAVAICNGRMSIRNLPSWNGGANPTTSRPLVWLAASDGAGIPVGPSDPEIGLETIDVPECIVTPDPGQSLEKYRFYDKTDEANAVMVHVGEVGALHVMRDGKAETWTFGNGNAGCLGDSCVEGGVTDNFLTQSLDD